MSQWNIAAKSQEERDKVNVDLAASGVAYKERLNMPVVAEVVAREQPEHLREYFMERIRSSLSGNGQSEREKIAYARFAIRDLARHNYLVSLDN
ncbi:DNA polymerase III subunit theta [Klebsiella pneumoniae]